MSTGNSMKYSKSNVKRVYTPAEAAKYRDEKKVLREARRQAVRSQSPTAKQVVKIKSEAEEWSGVAVSSDDWESDAPNDVPVETLESPANVPNNVPLQTLESKVDVPNDVPVETLESPANVPNNVRLETLESKVDASNDVRLETLESKVDVPAPTVHDALMDLMSKYNNPRVNMAKVYMFLMGLLTAASTTVSTTTAKVVVKMSKSMDAFVNMMVCYPKAVTETAFYSVVRSVLVTESPATEAGLVALEELLTKEPDAAMTMANLHAVLMEAIVVASCSAVPKVEVPKVEVPKAKEPETPKKTWVSVDSKVPDAPKKALVTRGPLPSPARKSPNLSGPKCSKVGCHETPDHNAKTRKPYPFCRRCTDAHLLSKSTTACSTDGCNMPTFGPKCKWCPGCVSEVSQQDQVPCSNSENPQFFGACDQRTTNGHGRCNGCLSYFKRVTNGEESMKCLNFLSYKYAETDEIAESLRKKFGDICLKVTEGTRPYCSACYKAHSRK